MSKKGLKWTLDDEIKLLEYVKINKTNHLLTSLQLERTLTGVMFRLVGIYNDRLIMCTSDNPISLMNELYLTDDDLITYKKTKKQRLTLEYVNMKIDFIIHSLLNENIVY